MSGTGLKKTADVVIAGGGLSGAILAMRFKALRPHKSILLFESSPLNHWVACWPFLDTQPQDNKRYDWLLGTCAHRWESFQVHFPEGSWEVPIGISLLERKRLATNLSEYLGDDLYAQTPVASVSVDSAILNDGRRVEAPLVFDARNRSALKTSQGFWFKHSVGLNLDLKSPHGLNLPSLMDARCPQNEGFQYFSLYPVGPSELYIEGVIHSDQVSFDSLYLRGQVLKFLAYRGWGIQQVKGAWWNSTPLPVKAPASRIMQLSAMDPSPVGLESQIYHYATGYALPHLSEIAQQIAISGRWSSGLAKAILKKYEARFVATQEFDLTMNRMNFLRTAPDEQYLFYRRLFEMDPEIIRAFFSSQLKPSQRFNLLSRQSQVPLHRLVTIPFLNA